MTQSRGPVYVGVLGTSSAKTLPMRQWLHVISSNLARVMFIPNDPKVNVGNQLFIEFHSGATYVYYRVPQDVWRRLMGSVSKGRFHHQHIKWKYDYARVG